MTQEISIRTNLWQEIVFRVAKVVAALINIIIAVFNLIPAILYRPHGVQWLGDSFIFAIVSLIAPPTRKQIEEASDIAIEATRTQSKG